MRKRLQKLHFSFKLEGMTKPREVTRPPRRASAGAAIPRFALYGEAPAPEQETLHIEEIQSRSRHERLTREACRRLYYIAAPAETLARELGFEDPAYFNRFFKRRTGLTPHRWREQNRPAP